MIDLKNGMKISILGTEKPFILNFFNDNYVWSAENKYYKLNEIDWETTKKLNQENQEHFELKYGMKFQTIKKNIFTCESMSFDRVYVLEKKVGSPDFLWLENIDWEATKNLNEDNREEKQEPFELKEGMKVVNINGIELILKSVEGLTYFVEENEHGIVSIGKSLINWEKTKQLNYQRIAKVAEEPKPQYKEFFLVWRANGSNPSKRHGKQEEAEKEAERLAIENPNKTFYVLKAVSDVKGTVKTEWSK